MTKISFKNKLKIFL